MENRFNLIDEPWIPVADHGRVSLRQVFSEGKYRSLGGNPIQKIALFKLLLAIAQAAATPKDEAEWEEMGAEGLAERCLAYLDKWHDRFYLYGEKPFLQMPAISAAKVQPFGAVLPEVATGNTTVLSQIQVGQKLDDGDKALLLVFLMAFALSGKKTDNAVVLTPGYAGKRNDKNKPSTGKPGPGIAHMGLMHSFLLGESLLSTLWLNLFTTAQIEQMNVYPCGLGVAPWEAMPDGEDCDRARLLKSSLMGRLVPLCRFCLLLEDGLHYSEGIAHPGYKEGVVDPTVAVDFSGKEPRALWVNPEKRPWRELSALLSFLDQTSTESYQCWHLRLGVERAARKVQMFGVWSGGLRVSSNAGEQFVSGTDDFVESLVWLDSSALGEQWLACLKGEMQGLANLAKSIYGCTQRFYKEQMADGKNFAELAVHLFWQLCEREFQTLLDNCTPEENAEKARDTLRRRFSEYAHQAYDRFCPRETARQLDAWAKCRPNNHKYLRRES